MAAKRKHRGLAFKIDKLTRSIENVVTGDSFQTVVLPLTKADQKKVADQHPNRCQDGRDGCEGDAHNGEFGIHARFSCISCAGTLVIGPIELSGVSCRWANRLSGTSIPSWLSRFRKTGLLPVA